jgi:hypothetical protein
MTPWGWGVGPRSPTYSETDLPQGQVPGYPPPGDMPGSHLGLGLFGATASVGDLELTHASSSSKQAWHIPDAVCTVSELLMMGGETA